MRFVGVIPARYESVRLPGKALLDLAGKPMVQWVYEGARSAPSLEEVWVATDDARIADAVRGFGGRALMTDRGHASGTDRVAEAARGIDADVFVNIQGDEPLIPAATIEAVCRPFREDPGLEVATARIAVARPEEASSPHVVKVVADRRGRALYFSRAPIPHPIGAPHYFKHVGIYAYRRRFLLGLDRLPPSILETTERLEQLRFLDNGVEIRVVTVFEDSLGVDTPEDAKRVIPMLQNRAVGSSGRLEDPDQGRRV